MGLISTETATAGDTETTFSSRARVTFTLSGETDNGLSFGASFGAHNAADASNGTAGSVFISGAFGTLSMGDVGGANEAATGDLHGVGYTAGAGSMNKNEMGYLYPAGDALAYSITVEGLTIGLSASQRNDVVLTGTAANDDTAETNAVGVSYKMGDYSFGVGFADRGINEQTSYSLRGKVAGVSFAAVMVDNARVTGTGAATIDTETGVSVSYTMDALTLIAFTRTVDYFAAGTADLDYTGIGANYNLGGGASLRAGYVDGGANGSTLDAWDLGVTFSF